MKQNLRARKKINYLMKRFIVFCMGVAYAVMAFADTELNLLVDAKANTFSVSLPANPTTGYQWVIKCYDSHYFEQKNQVYVADASRRIGSGGHALFEFKRKKGLAYPKQTVIKFIYQRPWDKANTSNITQVNITFD